MRSKLFLRVKESDNKSHPRTSSSQVLSSRAVKRVVGKGTVSVRRGLGISRHLLAVSATSAARES